MSDDAKPPATAPTDATPIETRLREAGLPPLPRLAWLEVDLSAIAANARAVQSMLAPGTRLGAVVKADGYGHGLLAAAHAALSGGAAILCVATLDEAFELRRAGFEAPIFVMFAVPPGSLRDALATGFELTAMDEASVETLAAGIRDLPAGSPEPRIHLGIDTGMTRGGLLPDEVVPAARRLLDAGVARLAGTWSHLASPEDRAATASQIEAFEAALGGLGEAGIDPGLRHLNSTGGLVDDVPDWDLVRVGLALYGHLPRDARIAADRVAAAARLHAALRLRARAVSIETVPAGTGVGYGHTWRAERPSRIAILPVGYADGWTRQYAGGTTARARGVDVPLVGRVSMDAVAADVTDVAGFTEADEVTALAPPGEGGNTVEQLAHGRGTIAWEVLADFSPRLSRVYLEDGRPIAVRYLDGRLVLAAGTSLRTRADEAIAATGGDPAMRRS
jgi:alanine racemase